MARAILALWGVIVALACGGAAAQSVPAAESRVALVIGNSAYQTAPLVNPVNDAEDVAVALTALGFKVTLRQNASHREMVEAISAFGSELRKGGVGLFYFAGHGVQSRGRNYLIPVTANVRTEAELEFESVDANRVLALMDEAANRINIVILDACRDNPYARSFRSSARGLAQMEAAKGSYIAFATGPGSVASDGDGRNGLYTQHLLESLKQPDSDIDKVFRRVTADVARATENRQVPWVSSSLTGDFSFRTAGAAVTTAITAPREAAYPKVVGPDSAANSRSKPVAGGAVTVVESVKSLTAGTVFKDCESCPDMVAIPAGAFTMGSPEGEEARSRWEVPVPVRIAQPFAVGKFEVTFAQWDACVRDKACAHRPDDLQWGRARRPVIGVSWFDAKQYTEWLTERTGKNYRLLTEAEWEYVARAGTTTAYYTGAQISANQANYNGQTQTEAGRAGVYRSQTTPVGTYAPNAFGLHDTAGNVWEWVEDCDNESHVGASTDGSARLGDCNWRIMRGGSWNNTYSYLRSAGRKRDTPATREFINGFRVARSAD